jgi:hypothetical protein
MLKEVMFKKLGKRLSNSLKNVQDIQHQSSKMLIMLGKYQNKKSRNARDLQH